MDRLVAFWLAIVAFFTSLFGGSKPAKITTNVVTVGTEQLQKFDGWGTSAAWWAQMVEEESNRKDIARKLYSKDGLGLNIYRYNVGAGVNPEKNRIGQISRRTESFLYYDEITKSYKYDFTRDANAQKMLFESLSYGCIDTVVLFANSPHYSFTKNQEPAGKDKGVSNLPRENYQKFVDYFLTITEYFISKGVPVKYISPINEPQWDWGGGWVGQEGCHYETDQIVELMNLFAQGIRARGLNIKIMAPESGSIDGKAVEYFNALKASPAADLIGSYAYHTYYEDGKLDDKISFGNYISNECAGLQTDMTEWCELPCDHAVNDIAAATIMARVIANDINYIHANSWTNWVALNLTNTKNNKQYSDGLMNVMSESHSNPAYTTRYFAFGQFSKFVPAGSVVLKTDIESNAKKKTSDGSYYLTNTVAFRTPDGKTVVVIVNENNTQDIRLVLPTYGNMKIYTTDNSHKLDKTYDGGFQDTIRVENNSITTVVVS